MTSHDIFEHDLPYLQRRLDEAGISAMFGINETNKHMLLFLNDSVECDIQDLVIDLLNSDPATHRNTVELWVSYLMDRTRMSENEMYDPDELRQRVRTEFSIGNPATDPRYSYARPYPGGLALTLRVAHATTMSRLSDEDLAHIPLSVDELFYYGQKNTDNVPIDYQEQCGPVTCFSTQSAFVSAKAANMPALMSRFEIHAPHGLFFMIPAKHLLYVAPVNPANISPPAPVHRRFHPIPHHCRRRGQSLTRTQPRYFLLLTGGDVRDHHPRPESCSPGTIHQSAYRQGHFLLKRRAVSVFFPCFREAFLLALGMYRPRETR